MNETHTHPNIPIFFEDDHLLAIKKPVNALSQEYYIGVPGYLILASKVGPAKIT